MYSFEHIEYFGALALTACIVAVFLLCLRWKRNVAKQLGDKALIDKLSANYSGKLYRVKFFLLLTATCLIIIAAANLRKPVAGEAEASAGIDVMIALDVSKSMLADDIKPSRLERAKECISLLIDKLEGNRVGLVLFAGEAFLQMPLTTDVASAKMYVSNASIDAVPVQGTVVGDALQLCDNSLETKEKKYKAIILISDGEDHDSKANEIAKRMYDEGVVVYTLGIGTEQGSTITEPGTNAYKTDINGKTVISKLNEKELSEIAAITGGNYFKLDNALNTSNNIAAAINKMDKKLIEGNGGEKQYASAYPLFLGFAVLFLIAEIFIPESKRRIN